MAGVLEPCRSVASEGALWFVFLGFSVGQLVGTARGAPRRGVSCGRGAGDGCDGETDRGTSPILGGRTGRRHGDLDAADADANQRTDLEELEPDGAASRLREVGIVEADAAQGAHQSIADLFHHAHIALPPRARQMAPPKLVPPKTSARKRRGRPRRGATSSRISPKAT